MESIVFLPRVCKRKRHGERACVPALFGVALVAALGLGMMFFAAPQCLAAENAGSTVIGTQGNRASIGTDSATGMKVIQTPPPAPQQENQGPQTIIVAPEVYPGQTSRRPVNSGMPGTRKR